MSDDQEEVRKQSAIAYVAGDAEYTEAELAKALLLEVSAISPKVDVP